MQSPSAKALPAECIGPPAPKNGAIRMTTFFMTSFIRVVSVPPSLTTNLRAIMLRIIGGCCESFPLDSGDLYPQRCAANGITRSGCIGYDCQ